MAIRKKDLAKLAFIEKREKNTGKIRSLLFPHRISGSIHQTKDGLSYLVAGTNITISSASNGQITITGAGAAGEANLGANVGAGTGNVFRNKTGVTLNFKTLIGGTNVTVTDNANDITIDASTSGEVNTASNLGAGFGVFGTKVGVDLRFKSLVAGDHIAMSSDANEITINAENFADKGANYITIGNTASLSNERALAAGNHINITDNGAGNNVVITAENFADKGASYVVVGTTASLPNERQLAAGTNISLVDNGAGSTLVINATGGGTGADPGANYVLIGNTASLANERALTSSFGNKFVDGGANSTVDLRVDEQVIPTLSGANAFARPNIFNAGLSGSLTALEDGTPYLRGEGTITVLSQANGSIIISGTGDGGGAGGGAPVGSSYIVVANDGTLTAERALVGGTGIDLVDGGANTGITASIDDDVVATVSGTTFTGNILAPIVSASLGFSGSLTRLRDGRSYIVAGNNVTVTSESNGQVTITAVSVPDADWTDNGGNLSTTSSLSVENQALFAGPITSSLGYTGSLTQLTDGTPYLRGTGAVFITTASNGSIIISGSGGGAGGGGAPANAEYVVLSNTGLLDSERALSSSLGVSIVDNGANSTVEVNVNELVVPVLTASNTFVRANTFTGGISGSLTRLADGTSYLVAGNSVTITSQSNGQVTISAAAGGGADFDWVDNGGNLSTTSSLNVENQAFFAGPVTSSNGFSGSLTALTDGTPYLRGEGTVTVLSQANGSIIISGTGDGGAGGGGTGDIVLKDLRSPGTNTGLIGPTGTFATGTIAGWFDRGIASYLEVSQSGGSLKTNIEFYSSSSFATASLLYRATDKNLFVDTHLDPTPWHTEDDETNDSIYYKIINNGSTGSSYNIALMGMGKT